MIRILIRLVNCKDIITTYDCNPHSFVVGTLCSCHPLHSLMLRNHFILQDGKDTFYQNSIHIHHELLIIGNSYFQITAFIKLQFLW